MYNNKNKNNVGSDINICNNNIFENNKNYNKPHIPNEKQSTLNPIAKQQFDTSVFLQGENNPNKNMIAQLHMLIKTKELSTQFITSPLINRVAGDYATAIYNITKHTINGLQRKAALQFNHYLADERDLQQADITKVRAYKMLTPAIAYTQNCYHLNQSL
ncbi:Hypothetical_protein [Hexamita inflata]|uniref:Hypothetical_protein n=1 Tax=Hexamita inflata TaxID=28002 RepID=A0AA86NWC1_9EUKA|nr:Hypothetical protein HINF_LOCUS14481 [Hexamita inflata]CAI9960076.1 Hypothetical protein HINF_LOCUS47721 [Hexamita inflata]